MDDKIVHEIRNVAQLVCNIRKRESVIKELLAQNKKSYERIDEKLEKVVLEIIKQEKEDANC